MSSSPFRIRWGQTAAVDGGADRAVGHHQRRSGDADAAAGRLDGPADGQGRGSVNFAPAPIGEGIYFLNCCDNVSTAFYKFTGTTVGDLFNSIAARSRFLSTRATP